MRQQTAPRQRLWARNPAAVSRKKMAPPVLQSNQAWRTRQLRTRQLWTRLAEVSQRPQAMALQPWAATLRCSQPMPMPQRKPSIKIDALTIIVTSTDAPCFCEQDLCKTRRGWQCCWNCSTLDPPPECPNANLISWSSYSSTPKHRAIVSSPQTSFVLVTTTHC